jgi:hypothetical protein
MGVVIGGAIMLFALGFQFSLGSFRVVPSPTGTSPTGPRLLALESTNFPVQATRTSQPPTATAKPNPTSIPTNLGSTATPVSLLHEQEPVIIGYSTEGRPLNLYTFGSGEHQRMIIADIHGGDEWNTLTLANQLIQHLNQDPSVVPEIVTLYILQSLNPDGEARAHNQSGRLNQNGVDLNRNFPINWLADWDRSGCWNYLPSSGGPRPGSELETQAVVAFIESHKIEALISYHSAALGIFPGGDPWDENSVRLGEAIAQVSSYPFPPVDTGCTFSGSLPDYAVSKGIAAVDMELTNHIETDFDMNLKILEVLLSWE